jgi:hypothetical protein
MTKNLASLKGYLQTRTAIKLIFAGKMNDLKQVNNWQLGYGIQKQATTAYHQNSNTFAGYTRIQ